MSSLINIEKAISKILFSHKNLFEPLHNLKIYSKICNCFCQTTFIASIGQMFLFAFCMVRHLRVEARTDSKLGHYILMYPHIARSVVFKRRNRTTLELLGNICNHIAARSRLSPQMAKTCKEQIMLILINTWQTFAQIRSKSDKHFLFFW